MGRAISLGLCPSSLHKVEVWACASGFHSGLVYRLFSAPSRDKSFIPRSTKFRQSKFVGPRTKVHHMDEGYVWVPKMRDFVEDPNEEFGKSKVLRFRKCPRGFLRIFLHSKR